MNSLLLITALLAGQGPDWPQFLGRHDMVWERLPTSWGESVFIGNGRIGATISLEEGAFGWTINRTDVYHAGSRYPIGRVLIKTSGRVTDGTARLTLWDAEATGTVKTERGEVRWRSFTATSPSVIVIELEGIGGESGVTLQWSPAEARPPSKIYRKEQLLPEDLHPAPTVRETEYGTASVQTFINGPAHAESIVRAEGLGPKKAYYVSIGYAPKADAAMAEAQSTATQALQTGMARISAAHRAWWHQYYPRSFVSFPDARLEQYYWLQIYKLGSAMRADGPVLDLAGPWYRVTPWPRIWWNLNIQLTYSPLFTANRLDQAESLFKHLDRNTPQLIRNVPERLRADAAAVGRSSGPDMDRTVNIGTATSDAGLEAGNLPWTMFYYYKHYRNQMDERIHRDRVYPLLRRAINHYVAYTQKGDDGKYHLPKTHSPEYGSYPDTNYDLALFRWGLETVIASATQLRIGDPMLAKWKDILTNLTPFPADDSTGLHVGRGEPWRKSHRHYSHLVAVYPLALVRPDRPQDRELIVKSLRAWEKDQSAFRGYSFTGGASMWAMLNEGDSALVRMNRYLDAARYMEANTFYAEAGPVIETPMAAAATIQEFFLQDWGDAVRVFPAVPTAWKEAYFDKLRADGAFLVSGVHQNGRTAWVRVESLAGQPLKLIVRDWRSAVVRSHTGTRPRIIQQARGGEFHIQLAKGASVVLAESNSAPLPPIKAAEQPAGKAFYPSIKGASTQGAQRMQDRPELEWWRRSMDTREERLAWWRDARFGMFIHWGAYSHLGGVWQGEPVRGYAEHIQRIRKIPIPVYKEQVVARFNPVRFDADEWMRTAKRAGMGYFIITAKHHDGFAMYDSEVSPYNIVDATPFKRDPMRELRDAAKRHGVRFGFYYSHAFDWGEENGAGNDWDFQNPGGDLRLHGTEWWVDTPALLPRIKRYVDEKSIPQVQELIRKYDPDIMWFDTPSKLPPEENLRILRAAREAKPTLVINGRGVQGVPGGPEARFGDYANTADRPAELIPHEGDWEAIPTTNESYGYHSADLTHKPAEHFVQLLAKAAARGGNLLMNIGPMGDGRFDPKDMTILNGIGDWMDKYRESIQGTTRTPLPPQVWGHSTLKGARMYLHVFDWPKDGKLRVAGLQSDLREARLMSVPGAAPLPFRTIGNADVEIDVPRAAPDRWDAVIILELGVPIEVDPAYFVPSSGGPYYLHVFDGKRTEANIGYADGKRDRDVTVNWNRPDAGIDWLMRVAQRTRYRVSVNYTTLNADNNGTFEIAFGDQRLVGKVVPTANQTTFNTLQLGEVVLGPGQVEVKIRPREIVGGELMRLRRIELIPIN